MISTPLPFRPSRSQSSADDPRVSIERVLGPRLLVLPRVYSPLALSNSLAVLDMLIPTLERRFHRHHSVLSASVSSAARIRPAHAAICRWSHPEGDIAA